MKITQITVSAGRTFNHPYEQYSNFRPSIELRAEIGDGEDATKVLNELLAKAEKTIEDHKRELLKAVEELYHLSEAQRRAHDLEATMRRAQDDLEELRKKHPETFNGNLLLEASDQE